MWSLSLCSPSFFFTIDSHRCFYIRFRFTILSDFQLHHLQPPPPPPISPMAASSLRARTETLTTVPKQNGTAEPQPAPAAATITDRVGKPCFMTWSSDDISALPRHHPIPCAFAASLLFFMAVEYTLRMVPPSSPPYDLGFILTASLNRALAVRPHLNTLLAALNTVFVGMQTTYILWAWLVEGRPRAAISALFMFTCRGLLGYSTQLPLPEEFLGSGMDFPVGNVSFFLFFSGHVAGSVIASLDMRRVKRTEMAITFDSLNLLQGLRLLVTRGHYTIDLAVGVGAGYLFDSLAGKYEESRPRRSSYQLVGENPVKTVAGAGDVDDGENTATAEKMRRMN